MAIKLEEISKMVLFLLWTVIDCEYNVHIVSYVGVTLVCSIVGMTLSSCLAALTLLMKRPQSQSEFLICQCFHTWLAFLISLLFDQKADYGCPWSHNPPAGHSHNKDNFLSAINDTSCMFCLTSVISQNYNSERISCYVMKIFWSQMSWDQISIYKHCCLSFNIRQMENSRQWSHFVSVTIW